MPAAKTYLLFPHQLFEVVLSTDINTEFILIEDDLYFRQYPFHVQKLILHRASMQAFKNVLEKKGYTVHYVETSLTSLSMETLEALLKKHNTATFAYFDVVDDWLQQRLERVFEHLHIQAERHPTPAFLTSPGQINEYFDTSPNRMQRFYEWQRRRLNILIEENGTPTGGKWSFDEANRKKLPKTAPLPPAYSVYPSHYLEDAQKWVAQHFPQNPGDASTFRYPITHTDARKRLKQFLSERFAQFGPYEDALSQRSGDLFHSVLSPLLNIGLLTPDEVVRETLRFAENNSTPIESVEGFIRQIIGWREYMRATYIRYGRKMRSKNHLTAQRSLSKSWWDGSTTLMPVDDVIQKVLKTGYAHHIERLMVLGNAMVLLRIRPNEVYEWFMSLFIDAYDWVMVPNVYAMSQFAAGAFITTKPYVSGSNYIIKMSDYTKGDWSDTWDALYWQFVDDFRELLTRNPRSSMMVSLYDRMSDEKKAFIHQRAQAWLE